MTPQGFTQRSQQDSNGTVNGTSTIVLHISIQNMMMGYQESNISIFYAFSTDLPQSHACSRRSIFVQLFSRRKTLRHCSDCRMLLELVQLTDERSFSRISRSFQDLTPQHPFVPLTAHQLTSRCVNG